MKKILSTLHRWLGLSAGLVLALMGLSGALYAFQEELIARLDPASTTVAANDHSVRLAPSTLMNQLATSHAERKLSSLAWSHNPTQAARAGFVVGIGDTAQFEMRYLNPYTGELLPQPKSEDVFTFALDLHRQLAWVDFGKNLTGAATIILIFMCISGLYQRWPRQHGLHSWLSLRGHARGWPFWAQLHAVVGTFALLLYLLAAFTGLNWSYESVGKTVRSWASLPVKEKRIRSSSSQTLNSAHLALIWNNFTVIAPDYQRLTMLLPNQPSGTVQILYLDKNAAHPFAYNRAFFDSANGHLLRQDIYAQQSAGQQFINSLYALHSGRYWGLGGAIVMALASLSLPLMFFSGLWMVGLGARNK